MTPRALLYQPDPHSVSLLCNNVLLFLFSSPSPLSSLVVSRVYPCGSVQQDWPLLHPPFLLPVILPAPPDSEPHPCCVPVLWHREFARWKVRNTAIERRDLLHNPLPLMPEFQRSIRLLGRRPTTQQFIDTIIKKYGTHLLISATLGGRWQPGLFSDEGGCGELVKALGSAGNVSSLAWSSWSESSRGYGSGDGTRASVTREN